MKRRFTVTAKDDSGTRVALSVKITTKPGLLTRGECRHMKRVAADRLMTAVRDFPYFDPHTSEMKVT